METATEFAKKVFTTSNVITVISILFTAFFGVIPFVEQQAVRESISSFGAQLKDAILTYGSLHSIFVWSIFLTIYGTLYFYEKYKGKANERIESKKNHRLDLWKLGLATFIVHVSTQMLNSSIQFKDVIPFGTPEGVRLSALIASIALTIYGFYWLVWGRVSINGYWSPDIHKYSNMQIVMHGAYRVARHPIYGGQILITLAIFFACNNIILAVLPIFTVMQSYKRLREEERALMRYSHGAYSTYREEVKRTFFYLPFI